jgi:hypothetical protein
VWEVVTNHPSGFGYIAHFSYENPNSTPVFVPRGPDNQLTSEGSFSGLQPELFNPGIGYFDIYFDGRKLKWVVRTYENNQNSSVATEASSSSARCPNNLTSRRNKGAACVGRNHCPGRNESISKPGEG